MTVRESVVAEAKKHLGVKALPNNNVIFNTYYYGRVINALKYAWCVTFVYYVMCMCGIQDKFFGGKKTAGCTALLTYYAGMKQVTSNPQPGDFVLYQFDKDPESEHIGIFLYWNTNGTFEAIEGNTSFNNNANGGCVMQRTRELKLVLAFVNPYDDIRAVNLYTEPKSSVRYYKSLRNVVRTSVKWLQWELVQAGYTLVIDGKYGERTYAAFMAWQLRHPESYNTKEPDGICGKISRLILKSE